MKKFKIFNFLALAMMATALAFAACSKDKDDDDDDDVIPVKDTIAPEIAIIGDNPMTVDFTRNVTAFFTDPGATATDNKDKDIAVTASGTINLNKAGEQKITYTAKDKSGNKATKDRIVYVKVTQDVMVGTWSHIDQIGSYTYPAENEEITKSISNTDRIIFGKFAGYINLTPYGVLSGNDGRTLTIPAQTFTNVGTSNLTVEVKSDAIVINEDVNTFTITYTLKEGTSAAVNCSSVYTLQ